MENKKIYVLRCGNMYLESFETSAWCIDTNFVKSINLVNNQFGMYETSNKMEAIDLNNLLYIITGIKFEIEELENE